MPGFVSHTIMAKDVYDKLNNKDVNLNYMMTYSLGGDLCKYAKCRYDSHHKDMDKFIYEMARYIKENNLINSDMLGILYGHICHYVMDDIIHPLVRSVAGNGPRRKRNHTLIEVYYDNYLVKKRYHITKEQYLKRGILNTKSNKTINALINNVYNEVYYTNNVYKYYQFNLWLYRQLRNIYIVFGERLTNKLMGLNRFLKTNKMANQAFDDVYELSVVLAIEYIKNINNYLKS